MLTRDYCVLGLRGYFIAGILTLGVIIFMLYQWLVPGSMFRYWLCRRGSIANHEMFYHYVDINQKRVCIATKNENKNKKFLRWPRRAMKYTFFVLFSKLHTSPFYKIILQLPYFFVRIALTTFSKKILSPFFPKIALTNFHKITLAFFSKISQLQSHFISRNTLGR